MNALRPQAESAAPSRIYWLCQVLGWGGYALLYYVTVLVPFRAAGPRQILADLAYCLAGFVGTHCLRLLMKRYNWPDLPLAALLPRLFAAAFVIGALQAFALDGSLFIEHQVEFHSATETIGVLAATIFFSALLVAFWLSVYFVVHAVRRRSSAELDALRAQVLARETRLRALQQQLNPHFLFNCLNSLRGMIDEDRDRARHMVTRLAELLRSSLRQDESNAIPLEEELATVEAYLDLESVRFEERLRIRREIDPETRAALVPPMLVQGLVENALKHGIARLPAGGELILRIARDKEILRIDVLNPGALGPRSGTGIGLANARERLRLLYGSGAELNLNEEPPGSVHASVALPFQTQEAACMHSS
jgi:signal transduction histidine kinase